MKYLITLTPLSPFFFGGDRTFGVLKKDEDKEKNKDKDKYDSNYLVKSRLFPQQTALLGMIRKEMLVQAGFLTKRVRGEWIDSHLKPKAKELVGETKFLFNQEQSFGALKSLGAVFLMQGEKRYIKKVDIDSYEYKDGLLVDYNPKNDIYDNFISTDNQSNLAQSDIFEEVTQVGIKKMGGDDAYFKKTSYKLKNNFKFAFFIDSDFELQNSKVSLGADGSAFKMEVEPREDILSYQDKNNYLTLLSDSYIELDIRDYCEFAITSEINFKYLQNRFNNNGNLEFHKSKKSYNFYEKGSIFVNPKQELIDALNNTTIQKIGYNQFSYNQGEK